MDDETEIIDQGKDWIIAVIVVTMICIILSGIVEFKKTFIDVNQKTIQKTNESILEDD